MIYSRRGTRMMVESTLFGTVVGALVVMPWVTGGYLLLLDWVSGPHQSITPGVYGLSGSAVDAMPFRIATQGLRHVFGSAVTAWLVILIFFPLAAGGIAAATRGTRWRVYPAVFLFLVNPFVVDRIRAGHVSTLLCLALLPWIFTASAHARKQNKLIAVRPALWYALAMAISPHAAWLGGTVILAVWLLPRPTWRGLVRAAFTVASAALVYAYALVVWVTGARTLNVTDADLKAYATWSGPGGLGVSVLSLRGFWRTDAPGWNPWQGVWFALPLLIVMVALVTVGLVFRIVDDPLRGTPLAALTVVGLLLGAGVDGPLGWLYRWAFHTLPLFEAMREQQKWLSLAVMGYAVGFGAVIEVLALGGVRDDADAQARSPLAHRLRFVALACACLPALIAPTLLWGLGGTITTSRYPTSWYNAERVMGAGPGGVLFLPWHAYQPFEFTGERTIATPGSAFFQRSVLTSDAVQLPGLETDSTSLRSPYVDAVVAAAGGADFGQLLAPLGVSYVVLADNVSAPSYTWLAQAKGLQRIDVGPGLQLYRVLPEGTGRVITARSMTLEEVLRSPGLGTEALLPVPDADANGGRSDAAGGLERLSPTQWRLLPGTPGWMVLPEEWSENWELNGAAGQPTLAGTIAFQADGSEGMIEFTTWRLLRPALAVSVLALLGLILAGVLEHRRDTDVFLPAWGPLHFGE